MLATPPRRAPLVYVPSRPLSGGSRIFFIVYQGVGDLHERCLRPKPMSATRNRIPNVEFLIRGNPFMAKRVRRVWQWDLTVDVAAPRRQLKLPSRQGTTNIPARREARGIDQRVSRNGKEKKRKEKKMGETKTGEKKEQGKGRGETKASNEE